MSEFEDNLWLDVVREHGHALAGAERAVEKRTWRPAPRFLVGTTAGIAAAATAGALLLGATATEPAFAVARNADGSVTIRLIRLSGVAGANRKLAAMGVRAKIVPAIENAKTVAALEPCQGQPAAPVQTVTVVPASIPRRRILLLAADRAAHLGYFSAAAQLRTGARTGAMPEADTGDTGTGYTPATGNTGPGQLALERALTKRAHDLAPSRGSAGNTGAGNTGAGNTGAGTIATSAPAPNLRVYCGSAPFPPAAAGNTGPG